MPISLNFLTIKKPPIPSINNRDERLKTSRGTTQISANALTLDH